MNLDHEHFKIIQTFMGNKTTLRKAQIKSGMVSTSFYRKAEHLIKLGHLKNTTPHKQRYRLYTTPSTELRITITPDSITPLYLEKKWFEK